MTPSGSIAVQLALSVAMVILTAYVAGRVHQWYRHGFDRDIAYREGYNQASHTLFQLAVRSHPAGIDPRAGTGGAAGVRAVIPRHQLSERTAVDLHAERRETSRLLHHQS